MNKKYLIVISIIVVITIAGTGFIYLTYTNYYNYEDERISITVPTQTNFTAIASHLNNSWTKINYNSSENNITIEITRFEPSEENNFEKTKQSTIKDFTENKSYEFVEITNNYTIYHNKEKNISVALIFDENKNVISKISCDNKLINLLANSFILKSFNTKGLKIENITINNTDSSQTGKSTTKNPNKFVKNGVIYTIDDDGLLYELRPGDPYYDEEIKKYR